MIHIKENLMKGRKVEGEEMKSLRLSLVVSVFIVLGTLFIFSANSYACDVICCAGWHGSDCTPEIYCYCCSGESDLTNPEYTMPPRKDMTPLIDPFTFKVLTFEGDATILNSGGKIIMTPSGEQDQIDVNEPRKQPNFNRQRRRRLVPKR